MTTTTKTAAPGPEPLLPPHWSALDSALWAYLLLPVLIFLPGFFLPAVGLPLAVLALAGGLHFLAGATPSLRLGIPPLGDLLLLAVLAAAWTMPGGAGHLFHANGTDWVPRFAVLRDLVVEPWPPRYDDGGATMLLRAPLGYYLPVASLAHATRLALADGLLLAWTWLGVALFFGANLGGSRQRKLAAALIFAFASGLDAIGLLLRHGSLPWPMQHIEWWAEGMQYSSNTTLLFWVPNHGLPGWIAAAWLWRFRDDTRFLARLPMLFLPVMLWSPLVALGLLPLAVIAAARQWRHLLGAAERGALPTSLALVALPGTLVASYLLLGMFGPGSISHALTTTAVVMQKSAGIGNTLLFILLEVAVFCVFLLRRDRSPLALGVVALLLLLPWSRYGPNNDLLMRASIPALAILWLQLADTLTAAAADSGLSNSGRKLLLLLFVLGAITPLLEIQRAIGGRYWPADTRLSAPQALGGFPPHYFVRHDGHWLPGLLRR
ncbi:MAG: hypothetical protein HZB40_18150 [Rhodocyclales bacterium]|nr:hypothetical protein [Rhodocyclales bacterium]